MMVMDWLLAIPEAPVVKPMLQLIDKAGGASIATTNMMMTLAWSYVLSAINIDPSADDLAKIAMTAKQQECLVLSL
jgi:phosphotransacetylase